MAKSQSLCPASSSSPCLPAGGQGLPLRIIDDDGVAYKLLTKDAIFLPYSRLSLYAEKGLRQTSRRGRKTGPPFAEKDPDRTVAEPPRQPRAHRLGRPG